MKLHHIIGFKIFVTVFAWCLPVLLAPQRVFEWLGIAVSPPLIIPRLLGAAYAALLVAYIAGYRAAVRGEDALLAVRVGVVSNGLAFLILLFYALIGTFETLTLAGQIYFFASALTTAAITAGLVALGKPFRTQASLSA
jgi:hypothetical protein